MESVAIGDRVKTSITRRDLACTAGVGLVALTLYVRTLAPTVTGEDAGEFIAAAHTMGICHPPGYPLWCLLAKGFSLVPIANVAYRCNLMSAVFGALCCSMVYLLVAHMTSERLAALVAALLFACSLEFWSQSTIAEVYTLNLFLMLLVLYLLLQWKATQNQRFLKAAFIFFGLSLTDHYMLMGLALPAFALLMMHGCDRKEIAASVRNWRRGLLYFDLLVLPLLVYLYLPLRAAHNPPMNWGNPSSWDSFWGHVLRTSYRSLELEKSVLPNIKLLFMFYFLRQWIQQFTWMVFPLAIVGFPWLLRSRRDAALATLTLFSFNTLGLIVILHFTFEHDNLQRFEPYFLPAYAMTALWIGCGLVWLAERLARMVDQFQNSMTRSARLIRFTPSPRHLVTASFLLLPLLPLRANFAENDMSHVYVAYDLARASLDTVAKNAIVFPSGDYRSFPLAYCVMVERQRTDVVVADVYGTLHYDALKLYRTWTEDKQLRTRKEIEAGLIRADKRPIYYTMKGDFPHVEGYMLRPEGLWYRVVKAGEKEPPIQKDEAPPIAPHPELPVPNVSGDRNHPMSPPTRPMLPLPGQAHQHMPDPLRPVRSALHDDPSIASPAAMPGLPDESSQRWLKRTVRGAEFPSPHFDSMSRACASDYWFFKGLNLFRRGDTERGLAAFDRVAQIAADHKETLNNLGSAFAELGFPQKARAMYERAIALYPDYAMAHKNLQRLREKQVE